MKALDPAAAPFSRHVPVVVGLLLTSALLAGITIQTFGAASDRLLLPPPGRMVDVDGTRLHLACAGERRPTIVLEGGATAFVSVWDWIRPELAREARVCAYDRAGLGWSEAAAGDPDGRASARRLHRLLRLAGEKGPFVFVGHSLGGSIVQIYADLFPGEVAGLVLVDPPHPEGFDLFPAGLIDHYRRVRRVHALLPYAAELGLLRLATTHLRPARGLPETALRAARAFGSTPRHLRASYREMAMWERTMEQVRATGPLGETPLVVLSAARSHVLPEALPLVLRLHGEMARRSTRGVHRVVPDSTHFTLVTDRTHARVTSAEILRLWRRASAGLR